MEAIEIRPPLSFTEVTDRLRGIFATARPSSVLVMLERLERDIDAHGIQRPLSVLQDWAMQLPLREQGTLLCAVRGCDLTPKFPLDSIERRLVASVRGHALNPADPREVDSEPGCFMSRSIPGLSEVKVSAFGHLPQHYVSHLMHACEVLGYRHPDQSARARWHKIYVKFCDGYHVYAEPFTAYERRLSEDRIANGTVVS